MRRCDEAGRRVPGDVAMAGFDDSPAAAAAEAPLSSVRWPLDGMAHEMTPLLRAIDDRSLPSRARCRPTTWSRASCGTAAL
jgi:DNA-binding LacI/PurR family transcriptional regulator